jgi:hypothetical protein
LLGFLRGYWSNFADESFGHHLHMFSALIWFGFLMAQPYLARHDRAFCGRTGCGLSDVDATGQH